MKKSLYVLVFLTLSSVTVFAQKINHLSKSDIKKGWVLLFDGESTKGWTSVGGGAVPSGWQVVDGTLKAVAGGKGGDIIATGEYADFELTLDYKVALASNSGLKYFFTNYANGGSLGLEYQIMDDMLSEDNGQANHLAGSLYDILAPSKALKKLNPAGEWNSVKIIAKGKTVEHWLNDYKIISFNRDSKAFKDAVAKSKFSKVDPPFGSVNKGRILLQEHGGEVSFRSIKIRKL